MAVELARLHMPGSLWVTGSIADVDHFWRGGPGFCCFIEIILFVSSNAQYNLIKQQNDFMIFD